MAKEKSKPVQAVDELQASARPFLKELGFRARDAILNPWMQESTLEEDTDFSRFTRSRQNLPGAIILAVRGRRHEAKSLLLASCRAVVPPKSSIFRKDPQFLEELELKE